MRYINNIRGRRNVLGGGEKRVGGRVKRIGVGVACDAIGGRAIGVKLKTPRRLRPYADTFLRRRAYHAGGFTFCRE